MNTVIICYAEGFEIVQMKSYVQARKLCRDRAFAYKTNNVCSIILYDSSGVIDYHIADTGNMPQYNVRSLGKE